MYDLKIVGDRCLLDIEDVISLLECKLDKLKQYSEEDSSWSYGIEELETQIKELKKEVD